MKKTDLTKLTAQEKIWRTEFGENYNLRNMYSNEELDYGYKKTMGISRTEMMQRFVGDFDREIKILEVGCNIGIMLVNLQEMGFKNLSGIEIQPKAIEHAYERTSGLNITEASAYEIPFEDNEFDLVFTTHVLIHLDPVKINTALKEIYRCSKKYIFGNEYYAENLTEIKNYNGQNNIAWKRNFSGLYSELFPELDLIKEERYKYLLRSDTDTAFLFEKKI